MTKIIEIVQYICFLSININILFLKWFVISTPV